MANLKSWKMSMPEDSTALLDLLEYGKKLGMQPAETARVIIVEWSEARRGRMMLGGAMPQFVAPPPMPTIASTTSTKKNEIQEAKTRGAKFGKAIPLDDD